MSESRYRPRYKDADYVPTRDETSDSSDDDSSHNERQDSDQPERPADTSSEEVSHIIIIRLFMFLFWEKN